MIALTAATIAAATGARIVAGSPSAEADAACIDSRRAAPGCCFFAIRGERHDGHDFAAAAAAAGATVLVVGTPPPAAAIAGAVPAVLEVADTTAALQQLAAWLRERLDPTVVAITGSLGKSSTKELTAELLRLRHDVHATPGNLNNHWGLPLSLLGLQPRHDVMVAELAMSHPGEIRALVRLAAPDVGVITNVAPVHMENFADLDAVAAAKGELAEELGAGAALVTSADDPRTAAMGVHFAPRLASVLTFGRAEAADLRAAAVAASAAGSRFRLTFPDGRTFPVTLRLPGAAGVANFLAAAAVAWSLQVDAEAIVSRAPELRPIANRGGLREIGGVTLIDESYNASPRAVMGALDNLASLDTAHRRIAVLGDMLEMGAWSERVHRDVGAHAAAAGIDRLIAVGALAPHVAAGALAAGMPRDRIECFDDAAAAASRLTEGLAGGDAILVKGSRGVHMERVVEAVAATAATIADSVVEG